MLQTCLYAYCRSLQDWEEVQWEVDIMQKMSGDDSAPTVKEVYEDMHDVYLVSGHVTSKKSAARACAQPILPLLSPCMMINYINAASLAHSFTATP